MSGEMIGAMTGGSTGTMTGETIGATTRGAIGEMITITSILDVEQHLDGIEAVIFDLDDTLYSEKEYVRSGYRKIAEWLGKPDVERQLWEVFLRGGKAIDEVLAEEHRSEALHVYRYQQPCIHLYTGVKEMLECIRKNKKVGIITDGRPEGQRAKIKALRLDELVDQVIITDELGGIEFRKPCTAAFEQMQKLLDVPFEKMVYIGDNTTKDFVAPDKLGMRSIWFRNGDGLYCR